ncbi:MAG: glycosyltransferase, partial [Acidimicrobiia bacterium]
RRFRYWLGPGQDLAVGVGGIVPNLQRRPKLALQVPPLLVGLIVNSIRYARGHDVIHAHWLIRSGIAAIAARRIWSIPVVVTGLGADVNLPKPGSLLARIVGWTGNSVDACTAVSQALCDRLKTFGVRNPLLTPLGVEQPSLGSDSDAPVIGSTQLHVLYVGSLIPRKSVETLLLALRILTDRGICARADIVGDGPERVGLEESSTSWGLDVQFHGEAPHSDVARWMQKSHVLVLPSLSEGRPVVVLEAMAAGLPVVVTDVDGTRELVQSGSNGYLFPVGDSDELANCLEKLTDGEIRAMLGATGAKRLIEAGLTSSAAAERFTELYRAVQRDNRGNSPDE